MTAPRPPYVLDSFAVLAFLQDEPAAGRVEQLLIEARDGQTTLLMAVVNLGEVFYKIIQRHGPVRADEALALLLTQYSIDYVGVDVDLALRGAEIKGRYPMSYADSIAAALALERGATLLTGDPEFERLGGLVAVEWLPRP